MDNKDKIIQEQREEICLLNEEIKRLQLLLSQAGIPYGKGIQEKERPAARFCPKQVFPMEKVFRKRKDWLLCRRILS